MEDAGGSDFSLCAFAVDVDRKSSSIRSITKMNKNINSVRFVIFDTMHVGDKYKNIIDRISIFDTIYTDDKCKNEVYTI